MNNLWIGLGGGGLIGFLIGYWIGRKERRKQEEEHPAYTIHRDYVEVYDDRNKDEPQYVDMIRDNHYKTFDIDEDIAEIDEYFAGKDAPEDDEPEEDSDVPGGFQYSRAYFINQDDFYTSRPDYEKITGWYSTVSEAICTVEGDDVTSDLLDDGFKIHEMLREFSKDDTVFWRDDFTKTDYEIRMEEGE